MQLMLAFVALVENNDGIITVFSPDSKILYRTSSQKKSMIYTDDEYEKLSDEDYYHPDYIGLVRERSVNL
jgi:hypothetical protein